MTLRVRATWATDRGVRRDHNEDAVAALERAATAEQPALPLWVICDGMGGHAAGEVASQVAIETLSDAFRQSATPDPAAALEAAIRAANAAVWERAQSEPGLRGMGTTVVAAAWFGEFLIVAHAGDSRAYMVRAGELRQLTDDHSWVAEQERLGAIDRAELRSHPLRHTITRALGAEDDVLPDVTRQRIQPGDRFLLCSDGLTDELEDERIREVLAGEASPEAVAERLIELANAAGGIDNISVVVGFVESDEGGTGRRADDPPAGSTEPLPVVAPPAPELPPPRPDGQAPIGRERTLEQHAMSQHQRRSPGQRLLEALLIIAVALIVLWFLGLATANPVMAP